MTHDTKPPVKHEKGKRKHSFLTQKYLEDLISNNYVRPCWPFFDLSFQTS